MNISNDTLKAILLKGNYIHASVLQKAEQDALQNNSTLGEYLTKSGLITKTLLGQAIAEAYGISFANIEIPPPPEQISKIPEDIAKQFHVLLFKDNAQDVIIASDNPSQPQLAQVLPPLFPQKHIYLAFAFLDDINKCFIQYRKPIGERFTQIIQNQKRIAPEIIEELLEDALVRQVSDIHIEPQEKEVVIRFRIDGVLSETGRLPIEQYENLLNRIKVMARLRIDEHQQAQDGAIRFAPKNLPQTDLRVSIIPTLDGEKVVIRLLSFYVHDFALSELGLSVSHQRILQEAVKRPFGMILLVGPTGSGKSTTLYAILKILNNKDINITTIEDPVEYKIVGINQIQVNEQTNLTFAKGLRSIVRQDPNIILVGEIRDLETAEIAVNSALVGHLLFSTFHANDSSSSIPRLLEMGIEPFLLASTLNMVIAQRLIRKLCAGCRMSISTSRKDIEFLQPLALPFFPMDPVTLFTAKGCKLCNNSGYKGRTAIFEFLPITTSLQDLILKNPSARQIWDLAKSMGAKSLFEDGIEKVKNGITTLDELNRVASPV